jgi:hypothetical protein
MYQDILSFMKLTKNNSITLIIESVKLRIIVLIFKVFYSSYKNVSKKLSESK